MRTRIQFHDDTLHAMARWAAKRYRLGTVHITFRDGYRVAEYEGGSGTAQFCGRHAIVELNARRTYRKLVDVLAHELTHCVAITRYDYYGHGRKFVKTGNELVSAWNSHAAIGRGTA